MLPRWNRLAVRCSLTEKSPRSLAQFGRKARTASQPWGEVFSFMPDSKTQSAYKRYLRSAHWKKLRSEKLKACGERCNRCGSAEEINVHHLRYRLWFDCTQDDLEVLCHECHAAEHGRRTPRPKKRAGLKLAIAYADSAPPNRFMNKPLSRLLNGCLFLQRFNGRRPFYLSVRAAGKIAGLDNPFHAAAYLRELQRIKWLTLIRKGASEGRQASVWKIQKPQ